MDDTSGSLNTVFRRMFDAYGPQHWWPGETRDEIIIGAVLTQNTNWGNVEKAITALREQNCLTLGSVLAMNPVALSEAIRPTGYHRLKAGRLQRTAEAILNTPGFPGRNARAELLAVNGVGPETADSILLYAFGLPQFVVDAYTKRIFSRLGMIDSQAGYHDIQNMFIRHLPEDVPHYNEYHALIVHLGKTTCRPRPVCTDCCLADLCPRKGVEA
jgi:endonuclease-3 related protein